MDTKMRRTLQVIRDNPGKNGPTLKALYRPAVECLKKAEDAGLIEWPIGRTAGDGWYITSKGIKELEA